MLLLKKFIFLKCMHKYYRQSLLYQADQYAWYCKDCLCCMHMHTCELNIIDKLVLQSQTVARRIFACDIFFLLSFLVP